MSEEWGVMSDEWRVRSDGNWVRSDEWWKKKNPNKALVTQNTTLSILTPHFTKHTILMVLF